MMLVPEWLGQVQNVTYKDAPWTLTERLCRWWSPQKIDQKDELSFRDNEVSLLQFLETKIVRAGDT